MDAELLTNLQRARDGDVDAFCYVVTAHRQAALANARALLGDAHRAEDAVQEAFLVALKELPKLRELTAFSGWLRTLVRTTALRAVRRRRPGAELVSEPAVDAPPARDLERAERRELVRAAVAELSPKAQGVIERYYLRGLSVQQTAAELGVPQGTVKRRLYEARERLRGRLLGLLDSPRPAPRPTRRGLRLPL